MKNIRKTKEKNKTLLVVQNIEANLQLVIQHLDMVLPQHAHLNIAKFYDVYNINFKETFYLLIKFDIVSKF